MLNMGLVEWARASKTKGYSNVRIAELMHVSEGRVVALLNTK